MNKNDKNFDPAEWLNDLPVQNETVAFKADEMLLCKKCGRKSPPNRAKCLYCGENFDLREIQADFIKPNMRKLESWESGFNLIYIPNRQEFDEIKIREISSLLSLEKDFIQKLVEIKESLPIARIESKMEAEIIREKLSVKDFETSIISDEILDLKTPQKRLRKIEFEDEKIKLILFNTAEIVEIPSEDLSLIISGSVYQKKTETVEKRVKSRETKTLSIDETAKDEKIIDIYTKHDKIGYRILTSGFDFSCLENQMSFLAFENIGKVFEKLKEFAPDAKTSENYNRIRHLLGEVWEIEEVNDSRGVLKKGIGNINLNKTAISTNLAQFTKYSRLQRHLL